MGHNVLLAQLVTWNVPAVKMKTFSFGAQRRASSCQCSVKERGQTNKLVQLPSPSYRFKSEEG